MDLFKLFRLVIKAGGYQAVLEQKGWVSQPAAATARASDAAAALIPTAAAMP